METKNKLKERDKGEKDGMKMMMEENKEKGEKKRK